MIPFDRASTTTPTASKEIDVTDGRKSNSFFVSECDAKSTFYFNAPTDLG
jgi:hypothetical protein